jgi:hypothetical protein
VSEPPFIVKKVASCELRYFALLLVFLFAMASAPFARSAEYPPGWPWRGVSVNFSGRNDDAQLIKYLAQSGVNAVEVVLSVRHAAASQKLPPEVAWTRVLDWADEVLDACRENHIVGILTFVQIPIDPSLGLDESSPQFWESTELQSQAVYRSGLLAARFRGRGNELAAYEVMSEPIMRTPSGAEDPRGWPELRRRIIAEIRAWDPQRFIVTNAGLAADAAPYAKFTPLTEPRIVYGVHFYAPHAFTHQGLESNAMGISWPGVVSGKYWDKNALRQNLAPAIDFQRKYNVPVWIGEFSAVRWAKGANQWIEDAVSIFDMNGLGWSYWYINGWQGWNPFFDTEYASDNIEDYEAHYVGTTSERWNTLKRLLSTKR